MRVPPRFSDTEGAILNAMYEVANGTYTSYTLAWKLNPDVQPGTPPAGVAFGETRKATEHLIEQGLVDGKRLTGGDGIYFNELKLTKKGQQAAIRHRSEEKAQKELAKIAAELSNSAIAEMNKSTDKKG